MPGLELRIDNLPVYWRVKKINEPTPSGVPEKYPFSFGYRSELGLLVQECGAELMAALDKIYTLDANVGYLQIGHDLSGGYGDDLLAFLNRSFSEYGKPKKILEIGCGGCYVLHSLHNAGLTVEGIDPSPVAVRIGSEYGLTVQKGLFPAVTGHAPFDLIFHSDVLEHIQDPVAFLKSHRPQLNPKGQIIVAVPDCSDAIAAGDISMIIHQHLNFFDRESLAATITSAGFKVLSLEKSGFGGSLYCLAEIDQIPDTKSIHNRKMYYENFVTRTKKAIALVQGYADKIANQHGHTLGCYVPLRAIPYIAACNIASNVRLFDDATNMHGLTIDGCSSVFENFAELLANPVTDLLVVSHTFGDKIKQKVNLAFGDRIRVVTITELVGNKMQRAT